MKSIFIVAIVLSATAFVGCSKDSSMSMNPTGLPTTNLIVNPTEGQTEVRLDAGVTLTFAKPVERSTVERDFHLVSQRAIADSLCPDWSMLPHEGMTGIMADSSLMRHMGLVHAMHGRFTWNGDSTMCTFIPDSMMTPRTQYMIHMGREMMQMMRSRMGDIGTMGGHGFGMMQDEMMLHFTTLDTTGTGSGHGGHH